MPRRFPLQQLLDLANERVDAAGQRLALIKLRWQSQQEKLQQLLAYQDEYRQRLADALLQGVEMLRMQDFHVFLKKLELAIRQQRIDVQNAQLSWEECQRAWLEERRKLKTFEILRERYLKGEGQREYRLDQREQDEFARNSYQRRDRKEE